MILWDRDEIGYIPNSLMASRMSTTMTKQKMMILRADLNTCLRHACR